MNSKQWIITGILIIIMISMAVLHAQDAGDTPVPVTDGVFGRVALPVGAVKTFTWQGTDIGSTIAVGEGTKLPDSMQVSTDGNEVTITINGLAEGLYSAVLVLEASKDSPLDGWSGQKIVRRKVGQISWHVFGDADVLFIYGFGDIMYPMEDPNAVSP